MENLTLDTFKEKIFDVESSDPWKYKGEKPAIIDFYADWCGPCKMVAPVLAQLSEEYNGKLTVYKVNTEDQPELSSIFGVQSIPSLLFIPMEGKPQMAMGALPKSSFEQAIKEVLNIGKPDL